MNPANDPSDTPDARPDGGHSGSPRPDQKPEIARSQPVIAGGAPVQWWQYAIDLDARAQARAATGQPTLNWEHSINDLLMLTDNDRSVRSRLWMARALGWPDPQPSDHSLVSPEMNAWLCKRLKEELVKHGSTMPKPHR